MNEVKLEWYIRLAYKMGIIHKHYKSTEDKK